MSATVGTRPSFCWSRELEPLTESTRSWSPRGTRTDQALSRSRRFSSPEIVRAANEANDAPWSTSNRPIALTKAKRATCSTSSWPMPLPRNRRLIRSARYEYFSNRMSRASSSWSNRWNRSRSATSSSVNVDVGRNSSFAPASDPSDHQESETTSSTRARIGSTGEASTSPSAWTSTITDLVSATMDTCADEAPDSMRCPASSATASSISARRRGGRLGSASSTWLRR